MKEFHGLIVPIFTPVDANGALDELAFRRLIRDLAARGADGLYVTGTTGEASQLAPKTWAAANQAALDEAAKTPITIYSGAVCPGTLETIERIHMLEDMGAQTIFATPTFYNVDGSQEQVLRHYNAICKSTKLKVVIYSISATTHVDIRPETLGKLAAMDNIIGIKDTRSDWPTHLENIHILRDTNVGIACVPESMIAASLLMGADAIVTALGNFMPEYYAEILQAAQQKDMAGIRQAFDKIMALDTALRSPGGNGLAKLKYLAQLLGICQSYTSMSTMGVTRDQAADMTRAATFIRTAREAL